MTEKNIDSLTELQKLCTLNANKHGWKVVWHKDQKCLVKSHSTEKTRFISVGEALALIHSEVSEALEEYRNGDFHKFGPELADIMIRVFHLAGDLNISMLDEINRKIEINTKRKLHHGRKNL